MFKSRSSSSSSVSEESRRGQSQTATTSIFLAHLSSSGDSSPCLVFRTNRPAVTIDDPRIARILHSATAAHTTTHMLVLTGGGYQRALRLHRSEDVTAIRHQEDKDEESVTFEGRVRLRDMDDPEEPKLPYDTKNMQLLATVSGLTHRDLQAVEDQAKSLLKKLAKAEHPGQRATASQIMASSQNVQASFMATMIHSLVRTLIRNTAANPKDLKVAMDAAASLAPPPESRLQFTHSRIEYVQDVRPGAIAQRLFHHAGIRVVECFNVLGDDGKPILKKDGSGRFETYEREARHEVAYTGVLNNIMAYTCRGGKLVRKEKGSFVIADNLHIRADQFDEPARSLAKTFRYEKLTNNCQHFAFAVLNAVVEKLKEQGKDVDAAKIQAGVEKIRSKLSVLGSLLNVLGGVRGESFNERRM